MADPQTTIPWHEHPNALEIARLLVRRSDVSLPRIASVLGFPNPQRFSEWFEMGAGLPPEGARPSGSPEILVPPADMLLRHARRTLIAPLDRFSVVGLLNALCHGEPLPPPGSD